MAAAEQHRQPLVLGGRDDFGKNGFGGGRRIGGQHIGQPLFAGALPQQIDRPAPRGESQPGRRVTGHAVPTPGQQGDRDRLLHRLLGDVEITEAAVQLRDDQAGLAPDQPGERGVLGRQRGGMLHLHVAAVIHDRADLDGDAGKLQRTATP